MTTQPSTARLQPTKFTERRAPLPVPLPQSDTAGTGTSDPVYALVSVLYHALHGADTYHRYTSDAQQAGDSELAAFFEDCAEDERDRAERAKALLSVRLEGDTIQDDADEDGPR